MNQSDIPPQEVLQIIVVGAGISGLAAAYLLKKSGHGVLVLEETDGSWNYTPEVIPSPPNMTHMLARLGLESQCKPFFQRTEKCDFVDANNGSYIGALPAELLQAIAKDAMANYGTIEGKRLQNLLGQMCKESAVCFRFRTNVANITEDMSTNVVLETGEKLKADLVVAADGRNSALRSLVVHREQCETGDKTAVLRLSFSTERLNRDPDLRPLLRPDSWAMWIGTGVQCRLHVLPHQKQRCEALLTYPVTSSTSQISDKWKPLEDLSMCGLDFSALEPRLQKLLEARDCCNARLSECLPATDTLVSIPRRIILVGSAAHSLVPGTHQNTSMALEDACTLSFLFSKLQNRDQVPKFISAYDEIRQPRAVHVHEYEVRRQMIARQPPGPIRTLRDERLRMIGQFKQGPERAAVEEAVLDGWGPELTVGTYDASAAAQGWWNQYGSCVIGDKGRSKSVMSEVRVSINRQVKVDI